MRIQRLQEIKQRFVQRMLGKLGIQGVGCGHKRGRPYLSVLVDTREHLNEIPLVFEGVAVRVTETGMFFLLTES